MSIETESTVAANDEAVEPARRDKRARRRPLGSKPALSMLAQGEPMVWLTGGALVLCLAMIVGLLKIVVACGMGTFWPAGLVRVQLRDGTSYMGEVTRDEAYSLSPDMLEGMPAAMATEAKKRLGDQEEVPAHRRLFRTGNFELTNTHFRWISDFEIAPDGETKPEWGLVVERVEWGRFYGEPKEFAVRHHRRISGDEQSLLSMIQLLESNQYRLTDSDEQAEFQEILKPLREQYESLRRKNVERFLRSIESGGEKGSSGGEKGSGTFYRNGPEGASHKRYPTPFPDGRRIDAVSDTGQTVAIADASPDQNFTALLEVWPTPKAAWEQFGQWHDQVRRRFEERRSLEKHDIGRVNHRVEEARLRVRRQEIDHKVFVLELADTIINVQNEVSAIRKAMDQTDQTVASIKDRFGADSKAAAFAQRFAAKLREENDQQTEAPRQRLKEMEEELARTPSAAQEAVRNFIEVTRQADRETAELVAKIDEIRRENARYELRMVTAHDQEKTLSLGDIVTAYPANQLATSDKFAIYGSRWAEFLTDDPREANSEGGVFPAIWGTVAMTLIMALFVAPFGVLAALYLREYAKAGAIVSAVRISINNLAGVPSIVFGVFGMGFFFYLVGAYIDGGPANANLPVWPPFTWFVALFALVGISVLAFLFSLHSITRRRDLTTTARRYGGYVSVAAWLVSAVLVVVLIATTPFFHGWFETHLPNPKFGKGALLWAALTLALLTLPVVIVATEEALSAVPNSLREGSYACGAGKWQTIRRIVLPHAMPGIMTGMILAMARGAGEVAPLMLVGAVKLAPGLPVDAVFPFVHADRSFMHLGFHIYDLGFQSQNSEAAKPMVYTTTLLLIAIIALLNVAAVWLRSRLRKRFDSSAF
jgi:ABC-type phosphate transport system permease subunit